MRGNGREKARNKRYYFIDYGLFLDTRNIMISLKSAPELARELAEKIRDRRLRRGWTQEEMARRAGIKEPTYVVFERTGRIALLRLLKVLDVLELNGAFEKIGAEQDLHGLSLQDVVRPRRMRGSRSAS